MSERSVQPPPLPSPVKWYTLVYDDAVPVWNNLIPWVHWLVQRFAIPAKVVPPCWHGHEPIVEELAAIWTAYEVLYDPTSPGSAAPSWLRELELALGRIRAVVATTGCTPREHRPDRVETWMRTPEYADDLDVSKKADLQARLDQQRAIADEALQM